jgi:hypothetical protein
MATAWWASQLKLILADVKEQRDHKQSVYYYLSHAMPDEITTSAMTRQVKRILLRFVDLLYFFLN